MSATQSRKPAFIEMLIELRSLDGTAVQLKDSTNVNGLAEKLARNLNCVVAGFCSSRLRQSTRLGKHNVPHHHAWLHSLLGASVPELPDLSQAGFIRLTHKFTERCVPDTVWPPSTLTDITRHASGRDLLLH